MVGFCQMILVQSRECNASAAPMYYRSTRIQVLLLRANELGLGAMMN